MLLENVDALDPVQREVNIRIVAGEELDDRFEFREAGNHQAGSRNMPMRETYQELGKYNSRMVRKGKSSPSWRPEIALLLSTLIQTTYFVELTHLHEQSAVEF